MESKMNKILPTLSWQWVIAIVLLLAFSRLIPHPPNFTPLVAMAIFAGASTKDFKLALIIPIIALLISDFIIGFHSTMIFVYAAFVITIAASHAWLKQFKIFTMVFAGISASLLFFIVTNFGAWLTHEMYPQTIDGLLQAYIAGIPFFKNTLSSTLLFLGLSFFASIQITRRHISASSN